MMILLTMILFFFVASFFLDPFLVSLFRENDALCNDQQLLFRIRKSKIVFLLFLFWPSMHYSILYASMILLLFVLLVKMEDWKVKQKRKKESNLLKFQFPIWLRQLQILLQTNTVSQSLQLSLLYAPKLIQDDLAKLIQEINQDALNITPYLNFLSMYHLSEIERAMKLLYRYNTVGKDDAYLQFNRMIQTTTKWLRSERDQHHKDFLSSYEWLSMIPLFGVTVLFLAIMCEILMNMFTNGIS